MRVNVLHHARCFDGAASAAMFAAFYRQRLSADATISYFAKQHRQGDPYDASDFDADETAVVDFRYTTADSLVWYFDHHQSAFQLHGERDHFESDPSGRKFHDAKAPSCTGFIAKVARERFGFDASGHAELLHWAEIIDSASFPSPDVPVKLQEPALRLMTFAEQNRRVELVEPFIEDLIRTPIAKLAKARYVTEVLEPLLVRHEADIDLFLGRLHVHGNAMSYELLDQPPRAYNKFIPYFHFPRVAYLVGLSIGPDGAIKLSAGYNPWLPTTDRHFDIAALCERHGGGGHPYVGGVTFGPEQQAEARRVQAWMLAVFRGEAPP
jgi:hypothetical protein